MLVGGYLNRTVISTISSENSWSLKLWVSISRKCWISWRLITRRHRSWLIPDKSWMWVITRERGYFMTSVMEHCSMFSMSRMWIVKTNLWFNKQKTQTVVWVTSAGVLSASDRVQTTVLAQIIEVTCADPYFFAQGNHVKRSVTVQLQPLSDHFKRSHHSFQ